MMLQKITDVDIRDVRDKMGEEIEVRRAIPWIMLAALGKWMEAGLVYDGPIRINDEVDEDDDDSGEDYEDVEDEDGGSDST